MKNPTLKFLTPAIASACLGLCFSADRANAQSQYFTTVSNGGTYSWDAANWNASGSTANSGPYSSDWTPGDFARFYNGANDSYTVTVNQAESNTGIYNDASGSTLTIADAGNGTGSLEVTGGVQGYLSTATTIIDVPIIGTGGIAPELSGSIYLNAANTYSGGTALGDSGNTLTYFNNNSAFGTGGITLNRTGIGNFSTLGGTGGAPLTIANNFSTVAASTGSGTGLNFATGANTPVTVSGTWTLGAVNLNLRNSGGSTAPLTLSGAISGTGSLILSANLAANNTGGTTILSAVNPFSGTVTVTGSGGTYGGSGAITLQLGVANAISSSSQIILAGGTLSPGGFSQALSGTLDLTASSTIDYTLGGSLSFAGSSGVTWGTGDVLDLANWTSGSDELYFGGTGLTAAQLDEIEFDGNASTLGSAALDDGYIVEETPEPSTIALCSLGGLGVFLMRRKKA